MSSFVSQRPSLLYGFPPDSVFYIGFLDVCTASTSVGRVLLVSISAGLWLAVHIVLDPPDQPRLGLDDVLPGCILRRKARKAAPSGGPRAETSSIGLPFVHSSDYLCRDLIARQVTYDIRNSHHTVN